MVVRGHPAAAPTPGRPRRKDRTVAPRLDRRGGVLAPHLLRQRGEPAARARRYDVMSVLKQSDQRTAYGAGRRSLAMLVVAEVAIAATLLVGGALMAQSFRRLERIQLGFRPDNLLTMELPLSAAKHATLASRVQLIERVLERVRTLPGVVSAGMTTNVPMQRG